MEPSANLKLTEKIPIFRGLSANQVQQVLNAGKMETLEPGKLVCKEGDNSNSMFILLAGEMVAKIKGVALAHLKPVEILGKMGVITNEPRSATLKVTEKSTLLSISKIRFDALMKQDIHMNFLIYKNH